MTRPDSVSLPPSQAQHLLALLEKGLPHCPRPYHEIAQRIGSNEDTVIDYVRHLHHDGLFRRVGLVVHHRRLGISANVMLVLDIPDTNVNDIGQALAREPGVTLCYLRRRQLPDWPYNLFCMIHGRQRAQVESDVAAMLERLGLNTVPRQMLFSLRAFKQRGARYHSHSETTTPTQPATGFSHE